MRRSAAPRSPVVCRPSTIDCSSACRHRFGYHPRIGNGTCEGVRHRLTTGVRPPTPPGGEATMSEREGDLTPGQQFDRKMTAYVRDLHRQAFTRRGLFRMTATAAGAAA